MIDFFKKYSFLFLLLIIFSNQSYGQYLVSGYLDSPEKNKKVYLSLLKFDELHAISNQQILSSTTTDSLGFFSFKGRLLSEKNAVYRIHANVAYEEEGGVEKIETDKLKNFHHFIFSNNDTIYFEKNSKFWFSSNKNTNEVDKEWKEYDSYVRKLRREFSDFTNKEVINQSSSQLLLEIKSYAQQKKAHPLTTLILLGTLTKTSIKKDLNEDAEFYNKLQNDLNSYYDNSFYALQFKAFIDDLYKKETTENLEFYKKLTFSLIVFSALLVILILYLLMKIKAINRNIDPIEFNLTTQEEKIAELIQQNKTNKEIASELFISLNTVKTHIRNLYAKLEVSNRTEFIEKIKNHPRD